MKGIKVGGNGNTDHSVKCMVCGYFFDMTDIDQVLFHETACEPDEVVLPEDAHYARLEDELPSVMPQQLFQEEDLSVQEAIDIIRGDKLEEEMIISQLLPIGKVNIVFLPRRVLVSQQIYNRVCGRN